MEDSSGSSPGRCAGLAGQASLVLIHRTSHFPSYIPFSYTATPFPFEDFPDSRSGTPEHPQPEGARPPRHWRPRLHRQLRRRQHHQYHLHGPHGPELHHGSHQPLPQPTDRPRLAPTPAGTACPRTRPTPSSVRERPAPDRPRRTRRRKAPPEQPPQRSATTKTDNGAQGSTKLPRRLQQRLQRRLQQPAALPTIGGRSRTTVAMAQPTQPSLDTGRAEEQCT